MDPAVLFVVWSTLRLVVFPWTLVIVAVGVLHPFMLHFSHCDKPTSTLKPDLILGKKVYNADAAMCGRCLEGDNRVHGIRGTQPASDTMQGQVH